MLDSLPSDLRSLIVQSSATYVWRLVGRAIDLSSKSAHPVVFDPGVSVALEDDLFVDTDLVQKIRDFFSTPYVTTLVRLGLLTHLTSRSEILDRDFGPDRVREAFLEYAQGWCAERAETWVDLAPQLWTLTMGVVAGRGEHLSPELADDLVDHYLFGDLRDRGRVSKQVEVLTGLAENSPLLHQVEAFIGRARNYASQIFSDRFALLGEDFDATFHELYVDRLLRDQQTGEETTPSFAFEAGEIPVRAVVIGEPGAGKSTLVRWVLHQVASRTDRPDGIGRTPVQVVCRERLAQPNSTVIGAVRDQLSASYGEDVDGTMLEALLALGELTVVFDGLDEIQSQQLRAAVTDQIQLLARNYPLSPIICATRRTGPEVKQLISGGVFNVYSLEQYNDAQVREYVAKWFTRQGAAERTDRFIGESRNLHDLRANPLMLALLCTLYTQQDYIPQSRRAVYERCASLMFHEWDPKRGIRIPNVFQDRGSSLLQAVALEMDRGRGFGETISEATLRKLVVSLLTRSGVDAVEANASASELVRYCTGRAWVLSVRTVSGPPEFGFTHRTFYEFYLAEAKIKQLNRDAQFGNPIKQVDSFDMLPLTRRIWEAFKADPTSVTAELMLQAAESSVGDVSTIVLKELVKKDEQIRRSHGVSDLPRLAIRLLTAAGADAAVAEKVLAMFIDHWHHEVATELSEPEMDAFRALLEMPSAHRSRFRELVPSDGLLTMQFVRRYARLVVAGEAGLYGEEWKTFAEGLPRVSEAYSGHMDEYATAFEVARGRRLAEWALSRTKASSLFALGGRADRLAVYWQWASQRVISTAAENATVRKIERRLAVRAAESYRGIAADLVPRSRTYSTVGSRPTMDPTLALVLALIGRKSDNVIELSEMCGRDLAPAIRRLGPMLDSGFKDVDVESLENQIREVLRDVNLTDARRAVHALFSLV